MGKRGSRREHRGESREQPDQPGLLTCPPGCRTHLDHIYILCYGQPVIVKERDYLVNDPAPDYPISHYVGHTRQKPPIDRIRSHEARSTHHIAQVRPGRQLDAETAKRIESCPRCGGSLNYYSESPTYPG